MGRADTSPAVEGGGSPLADADDVVSGAPAGGAARPRLRRRCLVVLNTGAGGGACSEDVVLRALEAAGVDAVVTTVSGEDIGATARRAAEDPAIDAVVAAGGDGTVSAVAAALVGTEKPLGVLPVGTLNHFAKDLGLPLDLEGAARVVATGVARGVDVGEVNGRVFVNNSSIGVYPRAVSERERLRGRLGKWLAMCWAGLLVLLRLRPLAVRIRLDGGTLPPRRTPFVFVGNNPYETALLATRRREAIDRGTLGVYVGRQKTRAGLLRLAARALLGRVDARRDVEALLVPRLAIESHRSTLAVAVDGELLRLAPPIRYRIVPHALRVMTPAPP